MRLHRNIYLWYATTFFAHAAFALPIWVIFSTEVLGLSNTHAYLLGIIPYGLSAFFEIPTGSWADKYGRARTYQIGTFLYIVSMASFIFFSDFWVLLPLQLLGALGLAMQSGGLEALVHDSLPENKQRDQLYSRVHGRKMALVFAGRVAAVTFAGVLFAIDPKLPFVAATLAHLIGLVISLFFKEVRRESAPIASHYRHIKETLRFMLSKQLLVTITVLVTIYTLLSEALFALYQPYFKSIGIDIGEFGLFYAVISVFAAIGALGITALAKRFHAFTLLLMMMVAVAFTLVMMLFEMPALTYLAIIPSSVAFGMVITLHNTSIQKLVGSRNQATAVSIGSFVRTGSLLFSVIAVGIALDLTSVATINTVLAVLAAGMVAPFAVSAWRQRRLARL